MSESVPDQLKRAKQLLEEAHHTLEALCEAHPRQLLRMAANQAKHAAQSVDLVLTPPMRSPWTPPMRSP